MTIQGSLFGEASRGDGRAAQPEELEVLITVKAAPNPSAKSGETVCVAGLALSDSRTRARWVRLYPVNFRFLEQDQKFTKYDIVRVRATPAAGDTRHESWRPDMSTLRVIDHLPPWSRRRVLLDPVATDTMCGLFRASRNVIGAASLGLVPVRELLDLRVIRHPGWSKAEQAKIDSYVGQLDLFDDTDKSPLEAPRFKGHYRWRCPDPACGIHEQTVIDWEFVALQRRLRDHPEDDVIAALQHKFVDMMFGKGHRPCFYVGNQAKRRHVFHVLGVYYPN